MKHTYNIIGMTCIGCQRSVEEKLRSVAGVVEVQVDLNNGEAHVTMSSHIAINELQKVLPAKYTLSEKEKENIFNSPGMEIKQSKLQQLKPLLLIFTYLFMASFLLNYKDWGIEQAMLDFMGLFYIVFSFFKFLDLKGFPESFRMYDPLAKIIPIYGLIYPFLELALGLMFLMRFELTLALIITLVVLGVTTIGVTMAIRDKKTIRCACLGTALNLPMTEATFIENTIMIVMAISMLIKII